LAHVLIGDRVHFGGAPVSAEETTRRLREEAPGRRPPPKLTVVAG
jgi:hypothetical protein